MSGINEPTASRAEKLRRPRPPTAQSNNDRAPASWAYRPLRPREFNIDIFQLGNVDRAYAESRTARHSQDSRNPLHAGDDFRGLQVQFAGKASPRRFFLFLACYPPFLAALCRGAAYNVGMADYLIARCPSRPGLPPHSHRAP